MLKVHITYIYYRKKNFYVLTPVFAKRKLIKALYLYPLPFRYFVYNLVHKAYIKSYPCFAKRKHP